MNYPYYCCTVHRDTDGYPSRFQSKSDVCCPGRELQIKNDVWTQYPFFKCAHCEFETQRFDDGIPDYDEEFECPKCEKISIILDRVDICELQFEAKYE